MTLKNRNIQNIFKISVLLVVIASFLFRPASVLAMGDHSLLPSFTEFSRSVQNGDANTLRGVYVSGVLALPVVQQPSSNAGYVSVYDNEATEFQMASQFGNVGLLAHNYLSGRSFSQLAVGQEVRLVYGDGSVEYFVVSEILRYQALQSASVYSSFRNLERNEVLSAENMFKRVYFGDRHVTFQTCIEAEGNLNWGRLFVVTVPKSDFAGLVTN
ncbi:MAG TPA: hypothetical protein DCX53_07725 [Anaerolineae bacterium]|nr:hypothetical protein [Anaerolineae bacterium]